MQFAQGGEGAEGARRRRGLDLMPVLRWATALYWIASIGLGVLRLRDSEFSQQAIGEVLTVWYAEALVFLAVFGGAAMLAGVFSRQTRARARVRPNDPLGNTTLAAIERHRAH